MKRLDFKDIKNARDFGGTINKEGKTIIPGLFIRSGNLKHIKFSDKFKLKHEYKIKTVIDLRTEVEVAERPDKKIRGVKYYNLPLINHRAEGVTHEKQKDHSDKFPNFEDIYEAIVLDDFAIKNFKKVFDIILDLNNAPVLIHCTAGKDRTGLVSMLLLYLLDVDQTRVEKDYLESNVTCIPESERAYERVLEKTMNPTLAEKIRLTHIVDIKYLNRAVNAINGNFGSVDNYIKNVIGITDEQKNNFKEKVLK